MTIRQLYYTSCEHGRDGIYGFQVNAATPGMSTAAERLAVRASSYEPSAARLASAAEPDPGTFPVALGFARAEGETTIFASRYVGRDFTGRLGNYFAHAVTLDDVDTDLGGLLPIDLWSSKFWVWTPVSHPDLPEVPSLPARSGPDIDETVRFLAAPERRETLGAALGGAALVAGAHPLRAQVASPAVRQRAREAGIDLRQLRGSGVRIL